MNGIGQPERATQNRIIRLFVDELGYTYLGDRTDSDNSNVEEPLLRSWLEKQNKFTSDEINSAISKLKNDAAGLGSSLYDNNKTVYGKLRYGIGVNVHPGRPETTIKVIDWSNPANNDFAIAEEVTLRGGHTRRPDLVLYVNGIAVAVIELKNSRVSIGEGIRQCLSNQRPEFNASFFSTIQFVFAGNDSDGLKYGTILTPEQFFLKWKEDEQDDTRLKIDKYLLKLCNKERLIDLMHDFVLFENGIKKVPRPHQYVAVKKAQVAVRRRQGGIIWHTQGSGKSIVMVWLAKWILENYPNARIAIVTDRDELDKQIERVFTDAGEDIFRTKSGRDLMRRLAEAKPRLLCSLVHKFGNRGEKGFEDFIRELTENPVQVHGELFVFVDECHRTQSGKLHRAMKAIMPNAVFFGFTGTPLLRKDRATTFEVFGKYIHTYKFSEAVEDEVVLDLVYEARDIPQHIDEHEHIDTWFDAKTRSLNEWQRTELKAKWATMQNVLSSRNRMDRIVRDIIFDFSVKPRLSSERGNAILIASSIYEACKYFDLFQKTVFKNRCAVVTSYNPSTQNVTLEETGANTETAKQFIETIYKDILDNVAAAPGKTPAETYEDRAKMLFIEQPANMRLLIVVDKLLTGFDAPPCSYLYIDKTMQDHGLFQAICRTNRLDGEDKDFGYIVDYMDLFKKVENAISVYSADSLEPADDGVEPDVLLAERLERGRQRLDTAVEMLGALTQDIDPNEGEISYIRYFCGNTEIESDLKGTEPRREVLYKGTVMLVRAYANIADDLDRAGYSAEDIARIKQELDHYVKLRDTIKQASGEFLDMKAFEADMRHLIDTYIEADAPRVISPFSDLSLLDLIVKTGIANAINERLSNLRGREEAVAETIENNVRRKIITDKATDPEFFEKMSKLLDELIGLRRAKAIDYQEYLKKIAEIARNVQSGMDANTPESLDTPGKRALFNNLGQNEELALRLHQQIVNRRPANFRGVFAKEQEVRRAIYEIVQDEAETYRIFDIVSAQSEY